LVREFTAFWIQREKEELNARIDARVEEMFARGWVEEVRGLVAKHGVEKVQGFAGIGYREIEEMLRKTDQISKLAKFPNFEEGKSDGITELTEEMGKKKAATELRGQVRSQMEFGNEERSERAASCAPALAGAPGQRVVRATQDVKRNICVATRQYAKRQLTWFAREPKLTAVILTGNQTFSAALSATTMTL
jgi:tRNA A37 N6-isopentenylltransferase MiaA